MAVNPNTDFTTGAVLTAAQQNRFPRGVMAFSLITANVNIVNAETTFTSVTFTAVANRYYKITWVAPLISNVNNSFNNFYFRQTTATGTKIQQSNKFLTGSISDNFNMTYIGTFAAGSQTIFARFDENAATATVMSSATDRPSFMVVEDIGPA